jgi:hypothetical protein
MHQARKTLSRGRSLLPIPGNLLTVAISSLHNRASGAIATNCGSRHGELTSQARRKRTSRPGKTPICDFQSNDGVSCWFPYCSPLTSSHAQPLSLDPSRGAGQSAGPDVSPKNSARACCNFSFDMRAITSLVALTMTELCGPPTSASGLYASCTDTKGGRLWSKNVAFS